jgi:hypothetical protein
MQTYVSQRTMSLFVLAAVCLVWGTTQADETAHMSKAFHGAKANTGKVLHSKREGMHVLTLSDDFKVPDTPAPHWQVVDSHGNVYLLQRLVIKGDKYNKMITLPAYIRDVKKVQIWCAWAETLLGETEFEMPMK